MKSFYGWRKIKRTWSKFLNLKRFCAQSKYDHQAITYKKLIFPKIFSILRVTISSNAQTKAEIVEENSQVSSQNDEISVQKIFDNKTFLNWKIF